MTSKYSMNINESMPIKLLVPSLTWVDSVGASIRHLLHLEREPVLHVLDIHILAALDLHLKVKQSGRLAADSLQRLLSRYGRRYRGTFRTDDGITVCVPFPILIKVFSLVFLLFVALVDLVAYEARDLAEREVGLTVPTYQKVILLLYWNIQTTFIWICVLFYTIIHNSRGCFGGYRDKWLVKR